MNHMTPEEILDQMEELFPDAHCELNHRNAYELLVAVVLSAQTTDASVNRVTPALFARFPTPQDMAAADEEEIGSYIRSVCFDIPSFAVDTHVERVSKRLGLAKPQDDVRKVEEKLKRKLPRERWNKGHHLFIFFGRYLCTSRSPKCGICPFSSICRRQKIEAKNA